MPSIDRRHFLRTTAAAALAAHVSALRAAESPRFRLSLGQWNFHRAFRGEPGVRKRDALEFPTMAGELGFEGVDYSGLLLGDHHLNPQSIQELNRRAADAGVKNVLILVDLWVPIGAADEATRKANVEKFRPWLAAAAALGCTGIRVNAIGETAQSPDEQARLVADGLTKMLEFSTPLKLDVLVENHGEGVRCDGAWIAQVVKTVNNPRCGTLPDFGNFHKNRAAGEFHDRYAGVAAMLPYAKCISAKAHDFDANGDECYSDYARLLRMISESSYRGWLEVEYEGPGGAPRTPKPERTPGPALSESEGALATRRLLAKHLGDQLALRK